MKKYLFLLLMGFACQRTQLPRAAFDTQPRPSLPDYALTENWAALPTKTDPADNVPVGSPFKDDQATATADVFFVHPTTLTNYEQTEWNADLADFNLNARTDNSTILNQASVFNGSCKVYAPRYRQAHVFAFNKKCPLPDSKQALDLAYADVRAAFVHYLENWNARRPIVIAGHSQGSVHAKRLLLEFFDGKPLQNQLVGAYIIGMSLDKSTFTNLKSIEALGEVGTVASWCSFTRGHHPEIGFFREGPTLLSTNPMLWNSSEVFAAKDKNKGGVGQKFKFVPEATDAQNQNGILWIAQPYIRGRAFLRVKVWHVADINFFYGNIRENLAAQCANFTKKQAGR